MAGPWGDAPPGRPPSEYTDHQRGKPIAKLRIGQGTRLNFWTRLENLRMSGQEKCTETD